MRAVLFHNVVAPYRHSLFRALAERERVEVWYSTRRTRDRDWTTEISNGYPSVVLHSWTTYALGRPVIVCPGLVHRLRRSQPHVVVAVLTRSNWIDILRICRWGTRARVPVLLWVGQVEQETYDDGLSSMVGSVSEWYYRRALRSASGFLYYSEKSRRWAERRGARGPHLVGTQVLDESAQTARVTVSGRPGHVTALFVGKLERRKGLDLLLDAVGRLPLDVQRRLRVRFVGSGPWAERVVGARLSPVRTECVGPMPRTALWQEYRQADFLVLPSRHDPWGFVTNEAMSVGTPVLTTRQAGSAELAARSGWVCDLRRPDDLHEALLRAVAECRERWRRPASLEAVHAYGPGRCADGVARLLHEVIGR